MNKATIVIRVKTVDEIQEVYGMVLKDINKIFSFEYRENCFFHKMCRDYALVETPIHKITIELHKDNPYWMKGRRANLIVLKDFLPESQDAYYDIYNHMVCIGGFVIDYDTFVKHYGENSRGIMKYDEMVNYHDYRSSQLEIEEAIGIEKHQSWTI